MSVKLSHTEELNGTYLEITVDYDPKENEVVGISGICIGHGVFSTPIGDLFITHVPEMDVAINKIIDRVVWRDLYRDSA